MSDPIVKSLCDKFYRRSELGQAKYGKNLMRDDLSRLDWLHHLQQELMDAALYLERLIYDESHYHDDGK